MRIGGNRPYRDSRPPENRQPKRSFTGSSKFCLQPSVGDTQVIAFEREQGIANERGGRFTESAAGKILRVGDLIVGGISGCIDGNAAVDDQRNS